MSIVLNMMVFGAVLNVLTRSNVTNDIHNIVNDNLHNLSTINLELNSQTFANSEISVMEHTYGFGANVPLKNFKGKLIDEQKYSTDSENSTEIQDFDEFDEILFDDDNHNDNNEWVIVEPAFKTTTEEDEFVIVPSGDTNKNTSYTENELKFIEEEYVITF